MLVNYNNKVMQNIKDTLSNLKAKIGKMLIFGIGPLAVDKDGEEQVCSALDGLKEVGINNLILYRNNIDSPETLETTVIYFKNDKGDSSIPPLVMLDQEGGKVLRLKKENGFKGYKNGDYPSAKCIGENYLSSEEARKKLQPYEVDHNINEIDFKKPDITETAFSIYGQMAEELQQYSIDIALGPVVDLDLGNKVISEYDRSYNYDSAKVSEYASAYIEAMAKYGVKSACKHFPGHGAKGGDSHKGYVDLSETFTKSELLPYQNLILDHNAGNIPQFAIMTAHVVNKQLDDSGLPATLSKPIIAGLKNGSIFAESDSFGDNNATNLNPKINVAKFTGPVISDDMMMLAIQNEYDLPNAIIGAINAGCDMLMFSNHPYCSGKWGVVKPGDVVAIIEKAVDNQLIDPSRIDDAIDRIDSWIV